MTAVKKTLTRTKAKERAWKAFSLYIRTRDYKRGCVTCKRKYPIKQLQAGHWIPGRHASVLFDERNCHAQCYGCNVMKKGNPILYYHYMEKRYGKKIMEELEELDKEDVHYKVSDYLEIEQFYKSKIGPVG